jgi:hypothetical protein
MERTKKEKLIALFFSAAPHCLSYQYRKAYSSYKEDLPILRELIAEKKVRQAGKTPKFVIYEWIGEVPLQHNPAMLRNLEAVSNAFRKKFKHEKR